MARDTIAAIATAAGTAGIGIVRISGKLSAQIGKQLTGLDLPPRYAKTCQFSTPDGTIIDQGIALFFAAPASYTGEDVLEIHGHGGRRNLQLLLNMSIAQGARHALPGEFTERAFLNGKIDLLQAEAIADLIESASDQAVLSAAQSLSGRFSAEIASLHKDLLALCAWQEGLLDFPDDEIPDLDANMQQQQLQHCLQQLQAIQQRAKRGAQMRSGVHMVIVGEPNVGKSSLLNRLSESDSAIVSATAGTTRDVVTAAVQIGGIPTTLADTAGFRSGGGEIEQAGMRRAIEQIKLADIILLVVAYPQQGDPPLLDRILALKKPAAAIFVVYNKIDLATKPARQPQAVNDCPALFVSAKQNDGIDTLRHAIQQHLAGHAGTEDAILARERHLTALAAAANALTRACELMPQPPELTAEILREALSALDEIVGKTSTEELLGNIFARFCIGK